MSKKTVSVTAAWRRDEILPVVITAAIGIGILLWGILSGTAIIAGYVVGTVIALGTSLYLVYENLKRKKRSTLIAELDENAGYRIKVWMVKPKKFKWKGVLDKEKNNVSSLADTKKILFRVFEDSHTVVFSTESGEGAVTVPVRLIQNSSEVQAFIQEALKVADVNKIVFDNADEKKRFIDLIETNEFNAVREDEKVISQPSQEWDKRSNGWVDTKPVEPGFKELDEALNASPSVVESNKNVIASANNIHATRTISYDSYADKSTSELIEDALNKEFSILDADDSR